MTDRQRREQLETAQAAIRRLKEELADHPPISGERRRLRLITLELEGELAALAQKVKTAEAQQDKLRGQAAIVRTQTLSPMVWITQAGWAMSWAGVVAGWVLASYSLDYFDWWHWAPILAPWLLGAPVVASGLQWLRSSRRSVPTVPFSPAAKARACTARALTNRTRVTR